MGGLWIGCILIAFVGMYLLVTANERSYSFGDSLKVLGDTLSEMLGESVACLKRRAVQRSVQKSVKRNINY